MAIFKLHTVLRRYVLAELCIVALIFLSTASTVFADTVPPAPPTDQKANYLQMTTQQLRSLGAQKIIAAKCMSCHKLGGSGLDFTPYLGSDDKWVKSSLVVAGKSAESALYKYLTGSGFTSPPLGTMPLGAALSASELATIKSWIDGIDTITPGGTPTPTSMATPTPTATATPNTSGILILPSQSAPTLGDRAFVKSVLDDVFGPSAATVTTNQVYKMISIFGGQCDQMGQVPAIGQGPDTCIGVDVSVFSSPFIPSSTASRAGQTVKVCNALSFNDTTLQYAIQQATQKTDLTYLKTNTIPTAAEIVKAFTLFYPGGLQPSQTVLDRLSALGAAAQNVGSSCPGSDLNCHLDPWRYVFLALCYDQDWQVN